VVDIGENIESDEVLAGKLLFIETNLLILRKIMKTLNAKCFP
jgi:hypothetical protein